MRTNLWRKCLAIAGAAMITAGCGMASAQSVPDKSAAKVSTLHAPAESTIPAGPLGDAIRLGRNIFNNPQGYVKAYVGNGLTCSNCHINGGTQAWGGPLIGVWGVFPAYSERSATVETLEDRLNDCFERSMNGKPLPLGSREMTGLLAYAWWLSSGVPTGKSVVGRGFERAAPPATPPDPARGKVLFAAKCAACHGIDGQGTPGANGAYVFPPLWGPASFNLGAGMARLVTAASFVQSKMPLGAGGSLSVRDAYDIAAYFTRQPRPEFAGSVGDWPKGGKPADTRY
jgi:thiosulfate dehydrogenase